MSKTKSISDLVTELQKENESLKNLNKLFEKACKTEFGYDVRTIHQIIDRQIAYERKRAEKQGQMNV